jgi:hypothetical protein
MSATSLVSVGEEEEHWTYLGEIDPVTGFSTFDYSRASRWRPLGEFLWRR